MVKNIGLGKEFWKSYQSSCPLLNCEIVLLKIGFEKLFESLTSLLALSSRLSPLRCILLDLQPPSSFSLTL